MSNGGTQVVQYHFLKCHTELNVMIRGLENTVGADQDPPHFLKLLKTEKPHTVTAGGVMQNFAEEYAKGVQIVDRVSKTKVGQNKMFTKVIVQ